MRFWTHYWLTQTVEEAEAAVREGHPLAIRFTAGNQFRQRGVATGDDVYVISYTQGRLRLIARLTVGDIVDRTEATRRFGSDVWEAEDYLLPAPGTATDKRFDAYIPDDEMFDLEFIDHRGRVVPPKRRKDGRPDQQTFRSVREITERTARSLDGLLARGEVLRPAVELEAPEHTE